mgnify:CR=1 FL=1
MKLKLRLRFIFFFFGGLFCFIFITGICVGISIEVLIPLLPVSSEAANLLAIASVILPFPVGGILLGLFFVNPLVEMISLIQTLAVGKYNVSGMDEKLYRPGGQLKRRYFLYRELIADSYTLAHYLEATELERKQLETAKTNWIAGVSHDLKTPLSYITGYSSLLLDRSKDWEQEQQEQFLSAIHAKSVVITELIGDLNLSFKLDALRESYPLSYSRFDLVDFARRLLADAASSPGADGYDFGFQSNYEEILVNADEKLLRRAILNVVMNAIHHNSPGTAIELMINGQEDSGHVTLTIADNGIGMSRETAENLFQPYYRPVDIEGKYSTENVSGGLGLSVVNSIITAHGGKLLVDSEEGAGTAISFRLAQVPHF